MQKGTHHSDEARKQISATKKGKPSLRKDKPGTPHTAESKKRISDAIKALWAERKLNQQGDKE